MQNDKPKHKHSKDDIIIKDHDGTYKILVEGKFIPLDEGEAAEHAAEHGPKRALEDKHKDSPKKDKDVSMAKPPVHGMADKGLISQADEVINKGNITFASGEQRDRAIKVLVAHLKGIRKPFETKENLIKPVAEGGVGLSEREADVLLAAAKGHARKLRPEMEVGPTKKPKQPVVPPVKDQQPVTVGKEVAPPPKVHLEKLPPPPPVKSPTPPPTDIKAPKPVVSDVQKPVRAAVGPVEELAYSLADWRRLGPNPKDRVNKIENHLGVLEQEGYALRLSGIDAWHGSEVIKLYLSSGQRSLEEGLPMQQLLMEGGPETLSFEEWQAIAELDERIRP